MKLADLRVWALEQQGWSDCKTVTMGNLMAVSPFSGLYGFAPNPTANLEVAWPLLPLIAKNPNLIIRLEFEETMLALMYLQDSGALVARLICCFAYYAVEGKRVEIEEN